MKRFEDKRSVAHYAAEGDLYMQIHYVTDDKGNPIAVQIPLDQWEIIKAELDSWDGEHESAEIMGDPNLLDSIKKGREHARRMIGRNIREIGA